MINYQVIPRRHLQSGKKYYYAQIAKVQPFGIDAIIDVISVRTTIASADVKAVLDALQNVTLRLVSEGQSLRLGDLGSFRPTLTSKGKDAPEQVKTSDIKNVRVRSPREHGSARTSCPPTASSDAPTPTATPQQVHPSKP